jgi:hypothetical protein
LAKEKANSAGDFALAGMLATLALGYFVWFLPASATRVALLAELYDPVAFVAEWFGPAGTPLGLVDRVPVLAMAALVLLAAYGIGALVVAQCGPAVPAGQALPSDVARQGTSNRDDWTTLERIVFSLAVGLNLLATLVLLVGLAGLLHQRWLLWLVVFLSAGYGVWQVFRDRGAWRSDLRDHWSRLCGHPMLAWPAVAFATVMLLGPLLPPWDFDVREYHLQVPKEWLQQGQITFLPHNVYGNMPLAAEMPALLAMSLWPGELGWFYGALAGKVVIAAFSIITALALIAAGTRLVGAWCGILAAAIYLSLPWVVHVSVNGLNDGVLAGYVFLAGYAMWLARRGACSYLLPGLLAGGAAACKYPGVVLAVVPLALWTMVPRSGLVGPRGPLAPREASPMRSEGSALLAVALLLAGALIGSGAWYAKNAALAGNPVYPLAYGFFGGQTRTPEKHAQWQRAHQVPRTDAGWRYSPGQLAGSLVQVAGRDPLASPLLVPLVLAAVLARFIPRSAVSIPPFAFVPLLWIFAVWWLVTHRIDRFLLPAFPLAALLAAWGASALRGTWSRWAVGGVVAIGFAFSLLANTSTLVGDNRWFVSLEQLRRDRPWPPHTPLRVKASHQWLGENVQPGEAVLLVGDAAPFDLDMPVYYHTCFDDCLLSAWMQNKSASERHQELARRNIAWVVVDWPEIARYQRPGNYGFDPRFTPELVAELVEQGILGPPVLPVPAAGESARPVEIYPVLPATIGQQ